jgi:hypothetical protein
MKRFEIGDPTVCEILSDGLPRWSWHRDRLKGDPSLIAGGFARCEVVHSGQVAFTTIDPFTRVRWMWPQPENEQFVHGGEGYVRHAEY